MRLIKIITVACCSMVIGISAAQADLLGFALEEETSDNGATNALCSENPDAGEITWELLATGAFNLQYNPVGSAASVTGEFLYKLGVGAYCQGLTSQDTVCAVCSCYTRCCYRNGRIIAC